MFKNALVSVSDKTGLKEFLKPLVDLGLRVVSTGGTAKYLKENGIKVTEVSEQTGFPEVMDGRVRTLHPKIHMALLARQENAEDMNLLKEYSLEPFDLVIGNLYPFSQHKDLDLSERELSEYIDIGGPALLRAAAKNYEHTTVICDTNDYKWISAQGNTNRDQRKILASKLFSHISGYDSMVANHLAADSFSFDETTFSAQLVQKLRYGENPQQQALWLKMKDAKYGLHNSKILQGKELSYNNLLDLDATLDLAVLFDRPTCIAVKHNNPCGVSSGTNILEATQKALKADPISVFGGIIALNETVNEATAHELSKIFLECVIAPKFDSQALKILETKKNLRLLEYDFNLHKKESLIRSVSGGFLLQSPDIVSLEWDKNWRIYGEEPSQDIKKDLLFAWKVCSALKSNAIAIVENELSLGLGMGQVSRIDSVHHAIDRMKEYHSSHKRPVLASDAFFPFEDSIQIAAQNGIHWVIQPGGSVKDEQVIEAAKKLGVNMIFTGVRHFRH
ncbi:MAG: bifunctional phosphoribosylaminoimidazolecarboxamide formyltransferase/IMP cyclohydrolase [Bdellovibrionota bacterium]